MARYLREQNPDIEVIGADPVGSIYSGDEVHPVPRRGRGRGLLADDLRPVASSTATCASPTATRFLTTRRLAETEGMLRRRLVRPRRARRARGRARDRRPGGAGRRGPARRRPRLPLEDLQRHLDGLARDARAHERPQRRRRAARQAGRRRDPAARGRRDAARRSSDAIALLHEHRVSQLPVVSPHRPEHGRRLDRRARAAQARGRQPGDHGHADRRRDGAAVPGGRRDRPGARGGRAARPATARRCSSPSTAGRPASSPAPTCSRRSSHDRVRHPRRPRRPGARPELRLGRPRDPPELDLRAARARRVRRGLRLLARGQPDAARARERARASSRAGTRARSPPAWPPRTRCSPRSASAGDHVVIPDDLYGGTYRLVDKILARFGVAYDMVDQRDLDARRAPRCGPRRSSSGSRRRPTRRST